MNTLRQKIKMFLPYIYFMKHNCAEIKRRAAIKKYLSNSECKKVNLGCGGFLLNGWLNTDLGIYDNKISIRLDATKRMPFPDSTSDFVYAEHLIERLTYPSAEYMLSERHRVLKQTALSGFPPWIWNFLQKWFIPTRITNMSGV